MPTLTGNVTSATGDPGEHVRVFQWPNGPLAHNVIPDALGDWSVEISYTGNYGIAYIREGHEPITHGPYFVEIPLAQGEVDPNLPLPSTGLLAFWDMEGTTTAVTDSQGNYPLTLTHTDLRVADGFANDSGIEQPDSATYYGQLGSGNNLFGLTSGFELFYAIKPRVSPLSGQFRVLCLSSKTSGWDPDNYGLLFDVTPNLEVTYRVAQGKATGYNGGSRGYWSTGLFLKPGEYNLVFCSRDGVNAKAVVYNSDGVTSQTLAHNSGNLTDWGTGVNAVLAGSGGTTSPSYFSPTGAAIDYVGMYNRTLTDQERADIWNRVGKGSLEPTPEWNPADVFVPADAGAVWDPTDLSTLFQDAAGTIPVTIDGDPVGLMLDKSGRGLHATQATDTSRPVWRTGGYLEGDGTRYLTVPNSKSAFNFMHNGAVASAFCGLSVGNSSNPETLYGWLGNSAATTGSTGVALFYDDRSQYSMYDRYRIGMSKGTSGTSVMGNYPTGTNNHITPQTNVLAEITYAVSLDPHCVMRVNGVAKDTPPFEVLPATHDATYDMDILAFGNGSRPLVGKFFGACIINKVLSSEELTKVRDFYYGKMGI